LSWKIHYAEELKSAAAEDVLACGDEVISGEGTTTAVFRGRWQERAVYLKLAHRERWSVLAPRLWAARAWCSSVELEARNLLRLQAEGIPVIPLLAWGTRYVFGLPVEGAMLSQAVAGMSLEEALMESRSDRLDLAARYGAVAGRLHRLGGYEPLRAKDFVVAGDGMFLLDREKPLGVSGWREGRAMTSLDRAWYRNRRSGLKLTDMQVTAWLEAYSIATDLDADLASKVEGVVRRYC
jgi:tRNA A-37 threonylcarbamoyl transferase component Bud32